MIFKAFAKTASLLVIITLTTNAFATNGDMGAATDPLIDGSDTHPYLIEDITDFNTFSNDPNYWAVGIHTRLDTDIDLAGEVYERAVISPDSNPHNFDFDGVPFSGVFDGNDHVVYNMNIDNCELGSDYKGLFGFIGDANAVVKNLGVEDFNIVVNSRSVIESYRIGGLCGVNGNDGQFEGGNILNCYTTGEIKSGEMGDISTLDLIGGLCGANYKGIINNCYSKLNVKNEGSSSLLGGFCGLNEEGVISNCYSICILTFKGTRFIGGIGGFCGTNCEYSIINDCYATGSITVDLLGREIGGFCGNNDAWSIQEPGIITDCYATGSVTVGDGAAYVGGFCGTNDGNNDNGEGGTISNCYSTGEVTAGDNSDYINGFCGKSEEGIITGSWWDVETSGIGSHGENNYGARGNLTEFMQMELLYTNSGWDFDPNDGDAADWWINDLRDYPKLIWQPWGDLDNDNHVNMYDIAVMALTWYSSDGDTNFNSVCELSGDWTIDEEDLAQIIAAWLAGPDW